ncbi:unnamed protein product [Spodoptera littoralis]|uniref:Gustatory receptor n=1 Tax=Spodoptera littoralis TaxID=7109 RepID=A0A9P0N0U3_SPOLI|nr:unnamed protein product [Spodoptera littoralis]CAH1638298.1 unnamed protein product [Spodoptera littoralis]
MKVGDVPKNGYLLNNSYTSMIPLIWILKIFALNGNVDPTRSKSSVIVRSVCAVSVLGSVSFYCLAYKIRYIYYKLDLSIRLTDTVQIIADNCQYAIDLYFVFKYGRHMYVEYFKQYEKMDNFLDTNCYPAMRRKTIKIMTYFTIIWFLSSFGDMGAWAVTFGWWIPFVHIISFVFLYTKMLTTLDLIANVIQIEARLRMISNFVQNCYTCTEMCPIGMLTDSVRNKNWLYCEDETSPQSSKIRPVDSYEIKRLCKCYLLLTEQVMFINKMYGFRVLLNTLNLLLDMVKILNLAIRITVGSQKTLYYGDNYNYLPGFTGLMRFVTCAIIVITLVDQCEQTYRQRERIINVIDHLILNKRPDEDLKPAILDLRTLLQARPICFNMSNFFALNYSLLVSIASVVVTYTIILLQSVN